MKERAAGNLTAELAGASTVGALAERLDRTGFGLALLVFCVPFIQPLPTPGLSTPIGALIFLLGIQLMRRRHSVLVPAFLARRPLDPRAGSTLARGAESMLRLAGALSRPRLSWAAGQRRAIGFMIALMALVLMLPIPLPFSNSLCAGPIALFALALLKGDGLMALLGLGASALGLAYHGGIAVFGLELGRRLWGVL